MLPGQFPRHKRVRSTWPAVVLFMQLAIVGFALMGTVQICLLGSDGIARRNTLVDVTLPSATMVTYGLNKTDNEYIIIGWPKGLPTSEPMIQLGDQLASLEDIGPSLAWIHRRHCETIRPKPTIVIYADKNVPMAMIKAVKRELQLHNLLKVSFAATPMSWRCWPDGICLPD